MLQQAGSLEAVAAAFSWDIPERFNMGVAVCDVHAARQPDRVALIRWREDGAASTVSYGELARRSNRLANLFARSGLRPGDRVAVILPQSADAAVAHIAIYKAGMIAVPLARLFAADAIEFRLRRAGVAAVITNGDGAAKVRAVRERLPALRHVLVAGADPAAGGLALGEALADCADTFAPVDTTPDTPALIIFTSGTTGPPKGALHGHRVLLGHLPGVEIHHEFMPQPGDVAWTPADWAWAGGLLNILLPCLHFGVPVVHGGLERFDPEKAFRLMAEMKVANAFIPPTALRLMKTVDRPRQRFDLAIRTIGSGGESLGRDTFEWARRELGITVNEFYGQTECNLVLSSCAALGVSRAGAIGKPVPGHRVAVVDEAGRQCAPGTRGQVAVRRPDPVMFLEYWQDPEATAAKFVGDWMLTGDQCVVDADGYFHFVGRDDDIINSAGYRVGPGEIEDCLASHPAVRLAAAVGKPDPLRTEVVKAYVVLAEGWRPDAALAEEIKAHVKARLAANIYPREVAFVDEIPLTTTGKVIRRHFREQARLEAQEEAQAADRA
ncbi:MAG: acetyl-CoA synthetase [Alphaproteobacteria bacterium]|nr:MAG: acetyl-CoA synthetase [Alphaproteobacteria bacterium]